jgi:hypothetical protein
MKYLCQIWFDTEKSKLIPREEWDVLTQECIVSDDHWRDRGVLQAALALQAPETAVTLRLKQGVTTATDGPFAEIKEHLGGFALIEATDMEEAKNGHLYVPHIEVRFGRDTPGLFHQRREITRCAIFA